MPRNRWDIEKDILQIRADRKGTNEWGIKDGSYSRGECVDCCKKIARGSQKVVNSYDICWDCYDADANPSKNYFMFLINELERKLETIAQQEQR